MSARSLTASLALVVFAATTMMPAAARAGGEQGSGAGTGSGSGGDATIDVRAGAAGNSGSNGSGGGGAVPVCTAWAPLTQDQARGYIAVAAPTNAAGVPDVLYTRSCPDASGVMTDVFRWVPVVAGVDLMPGAKADAVAKLPRPLLQIAPPIDHGFVNVESFFGVQPSPPVSATASAGGVSATVTATAVSLELRTGSQVVGDTTVVTCVPWGSPVASVGGCSWTPRYPSVAKVTGTTDYAYHGSITVVWHVVWASTDGLGGDLGNVTTSTALLLQVREIQTS